MISNFEAAFKYVILNEGEQSNDKADKGGLTRFGITTEESKTHRCLIHPNGFDIKKVDLELAKHVYQSDYWFYDGIEDTGVAVKLFDLGVNFGPKTVAMLAQEAINELFTPDLKVDGILGKASCEKINSVEPQKFLDTLETLADDRYVDIVINDFVKTYGKAALQNRQLVFLKGWLRRSNKRFYVNA